MYGTSRFLDAPASMPPATAGIPSPGSDSSEDTQSDVDRSSPARSEASSLLRFVLGIPPSGEQDPYAELVAEFPCSQDPNAEFAAEFPSSQDSCAESAGSQVPRAEFAEPLIDSQELHVEVGGNLPDVETQLRANVSTEVHGASPFYCSNANTDKHPSPSKGCNSVLSAESNANEGHTAPLKDD